MKSIWYKGCSTPEEKKLRKEKLEAFKKAFEELAPLVESKRKKPSVEDYDKPAWAYHRADMDGYNRALDHVLSLIDTKE